MSLHEGGRAVPRAVQIARILGYFIFLAAFFLPAVRESGNQDTFKGSFCAWVTLVNTLNPEVWRSVGFLAILSGWINPLMLLYVAFQFSRKLRLIQRIVAALVAIFIVGTWVYFAAAHIKPLIGHWAWIAGILMILAGEVFSPKQSAP